MSNVNFFKADLREIEFSLFEQFKLQNHFSAAPFDHLSEEDARMILREAHTFASERIGPTLQEGDVEGCTLTPNGAVAPKSFGPLWTEYHENGWNTLSLPLEEDGQGAPTSLTMAVGEMMGGANNSFTPYATLTIGAAGLIRAYGSEEQKAFFIPPMNRGQWAGTMVLTEPHAGSDVGLATTKAVPNGDGTYTIVGNKIFITGGDHDLTENIIHLVLARIEGAPKGVKGLSLFIVPKIRINEDGSLGEPNDLVCTKLEHKMGINGSATAALSFGDNGTCQGFLLGGDTDENRTPGVGIGRMFKLMNEARLMTGVGGLALMSTAYLNALSYARTRRQGAHLTQGRPPEGAVPIIQHADVRRMLLEMKAHLDGCRALSYWACSLADKVDQLTAEGNQEAAQAEEGYYSLILPLVKAYITDMAIEVTSTGMQVLGGAGYTKDFPAEQYLRDSRILAIYEGANGIQAMDLVGRKLMSEGGKPIGRFSEEIKQFIATIQSDGEFDTEAGELAKAADGLNQAMGSFMEFFSNQKMEMIPLSATRFLKAMSQVLIGKLMLEAALIARDRLKEIDADSQDGRFYTGKVAAARYFCRNLLPGVVALTKSITAGDDTALTIPEGAFSTAF